MKHLIILILLAILAGCSAPPSGSEQNNSVLPAVPTPANGEASNQDLPEAKPIEASSASGFAPLAVTQGDAVKLHLIDLATDADASGRSPLGLPAEAKLTANKASQDGSRLALASGIGETCWSYGGGSSCFQTADTLHIIDMAAWQMRDVPLPGKGTTTQLAFNPDGSRLALVYTTENGSSLLVFDVMSGKQDARLDLDAMPEWLAYALDGNSLAVYGVPPSKDPGVLQPPAPYLQIFDASNHQAQLDLRFENLLSGDWCLENCKESHEQRVLALWRPGLTLSPDGSSLYIVHADRETLTSIDLTQGTVNDAVIVPATSWLEGLLSFTAEVAHAKGMAEGAFKNVSISPDGSRLYVLTQSFTSGPEAEYEGQQLQVVDLTNREAAGRVMANVDLDRDRYVYAMQTILKGGQLLLLGYVGDKFFNEAVSASTLDPSGSLTGWEITLSNGSLLGKRDTLTGSELAVIDPATLEVLSTWQVEEGATWLPSP